jgi:molybdopterin-guanine dinucleotide biosynthesis protein A
MTDGTGPLVSVVVLAGGQSRRLGRDKSLLILDGQPLVARTVHRLAAMSDDLIVVANDTTRYESLALSARLVGDEWPGMGSLVGIYSGLKVARHSHALAVACDMPFLNLELLRYMLPLSKGYDVVIPRLGAYLEPLHAIYGKVCLPAMARLLKQGRRQIIAFFDQVRVRYVEADEVDRYDPRRLSFVNVNTPKDWEEVQRLLAEQEAVDQG